MPPINTSTIVDFLDANLNEGWQDGLKSWKEEYSNVFNIQGSTKQSEKDSYISGFGTMPEKDEGVDATYDTLLPGIAKTYLHKTYALNRLPGASGSNIRMNKKAVSVELLNHN